MILPSSQDVRKCYYKFDIFLCTKHNRKHVKLENKTNTV